MNCLSHPVGAQGPAQCWKVQAGGETGRSINTILYHSQFSKITDDWASPGKLPKLMNLKAFSFINCPVGVVLVNEGGPGLPWVLPKVFLLPNLLPRNPKGILQ